MCFGSAGTAAAKLSHRYYFPFRESGSCFLQDHRLPDGYWSYIQDLQLSIHSDFCAAARTSLRLPGPASGTSIERAFYVTLSRIKMTGVKR